MITSSCVKDFSTLDLVRNTMHHIFVLFLWPSKLRRHKPNYVELKLGDGVIIHVLHPIIPWQLLVKVPSNVTAVCVISWPSASKTTTPQCNSIAGSIHWLSWRDVLFVNFIIWQSSWSWHHPMCEYMGRLCPVSLRTRAGPRHKRTKRPLRAPDRQGAPQEKKEKEKKCIQVQ